MANRMYEVSQIANGWTISASSWGMPGDHPALPLTFAPTLAEALQVVRDHDGRGPIPSSR